MIRVWYLFLFFSLNAHLWADVPNGGFEQITASQIPVNWSPVPDSTRVMVERERAHSGKISVLMIGGPRGEPTALISDPVDIQPGAVYVLTGWARADSARASARIRWLSEDQTPVGESRITTEGASWTQWAGTFVVPTKALFGRVICLTEGKEAAFDDVRLHKIASRMPLGLQLKAANFPTSGARVSRVRVTIQDSFIARPHHIPATGQDSVISHDGAVVIFEASRGQITPWAQIENGTATATLRDTDENMGGVYVRARLAHLSARAYVGDKKATRLRGRLFNAETGHPLLGRVIVADSLGTILQTGFAERGFVANGAFAIDVPPQTITVSAMRGLAHLPPEPQVLHLVPGREHMVELPFKPWGDLHARGWVAGDLLNSNDAQARGLDWAALPENVNKNSILTLPGKYVETRGGKQWVLGTTGLFTSQQAGFELHAQTRLDRGITGYTEILGTSLFDILAGPAFDALDIAHPEARAIWFALLNRGYRIAGTAFSDEHFRTYTHVPGDLTADRLMRAIASGQNMITNGPLISLSIFAAGPGDQLPAGHTRRAIIHAWAAAKFDAYLTRIELIRNAQIIQSWDLKEQPRKYRISTALEDTVNCWYLARCYGTDTSRVALTNPIYFKTKNFAPPQPVQAIVQGKIEMSDHSPVPQTIIRVIDPIGKTVLQTVAQRGTFQIWAPATSQIRVEAKGYEAPPQRIFDHPDIQRLLQTPVNLSELNALDTLTQQLQAIDMVFVLKPSQ
ncbi:MAG: CehA/McbA family metallohydrolase [Gemmatimonadetes bacterium]|nr:CehA/McbA family metallohydrolase [Gemmatimonadota bacterium]